MEPMENIRDVLIKNIKAHRKRLGLNQDQLAEKSHLSVGMVKLVESGKRWPSPATTEAMAKGLGITASELFEGGKTKPVGAEPVSIFAKRLLNIPDEVYELAEKLGPDHETWSDHVIPWLKGEVAHMEEQESKPPSSSSSS